MHRRTLVLAGIACALEAGACARKDAPAPPPPAAAPTPHVRLTSAPATGAVEPIVREELSRAIAEKRRLVVYVGAEWCEPCQRFHHAAQNGELDTTFPELTLLEFDQDRDGERLTAAGYKSKYIPLFALPGSDGRATGVQVEGGIKGEGAVGFITPRLQEMLNR